MWADTARGGISMNARDEALGHGFDERDSKALEFFKDWSNYLLVTTVAALGWVASKDTLFWSPRARAICLFLLAGSAIFGIFTLALIPIIAEDRDRRTSFYAHPAQFNLFGLCCTRRIKDVCFPQHVLFILGIIVYAIGTCCPP